MNYTGGRAGVPNAVIIGLDASGAIQLSPRLDAQVDVKASLLDVDDLIALADAFADCRPGGRKEFGDPSVF